MYEVNERGNGTGLGTVQNTFGQPTAKKKPGPERCAPGPGRAVPSWKVNKGGDFRLATDGPSFCSVRRIEPDIFILVLPPSSPLPDNQLRDSGGALIGTANAYFCKVRMYGTTIFTWSGVRLLMVAGCFGFSVMSLARSSSDAFFNSSETKLGILAAGLPAASAP